MPVRDLKRGLTRDQHFAPGTILNARGRHDASGRLRDGRRDYGFYNNSPFFALVEGFASQRTTVVARYPNDQVVASGWLRGEELMTGRAAVVSVEMNPGRHRAVRPAPAASRADPRDVPDAVQRAVPVDSGGAGRVLTGRRSAVGGGSVGPTAACLHRLDDVPGGDAVAIEQFLGLAAAGNLAHGEPAHGEAGWCHRLAHRVAKPARRIVILDGNDSAARVACPAATSVAASIGCSE